MQCRDQLRRSLAVQMQGRKALDEMRLEFEHLTQQLAAARKGPSLALREETSDTAGEALLLVCIMQTTLLISECSVDIVDHADTLHAGEDAQTIHLPLRLETLIGGASALADTIQHVVQ